MEQKKNHIHNDPGTWQTGRTEPPKRHSALISILLVLVILLCGISTALSILNFKLYKELTTAREPAPQIAFSRGTDAPQTADYHAEDLFLDGFGLRGTVIPVVYQRYYKLPGGIYVTQVAAAGEASAKGIIAGDIITALDDVPISEGIDPQKLTFAPGQEVQLKLYRNGITSTLSLVWTEN